MNSSREVVILDRSVTDFVRIFIPLGSIFCYSKVTCFPLSSCRCCWCCCCFLSSLWRTGGRRKQEGRGIFFHLLSSLFVQSFTNYFWLLLVGGGGSFTFAYLFFFFILGVEQEVRKMIKVVDEDNDGKVTRDEFFRIIESLDIHSI